MQRRLNDATRFRPGPTCGVPVHLFVSEYLCGGAWPEPELNASLACEGRAMLCALLADLSRVEGCRVSTTWDQRLGPCPLENVDVVVVDRSTERAAFDRLARGCDAAYVIAPELDDALAKRCRHVVAVGGRSLNCEVDAIRVCSDKLRTNERLAAAGVATIPASPLDVTALRAPTDFPLVVKPRFGAGSSETWLVRGPREWNAARVRFANEPPTRQGIVQPCVEGQARSVAAIFDDSGRCSEVWPPAEQHLTADGRFQYRGGRIPVAGTDPETLRTIFDVLASVIPGLRGYLGIDFILPDGPRANPLIVDVNPRLTTSYLGYRALTSCNLAKRLLWPSASSECVSWRAEDVCFDASGTILSRSPQSARPFRAEEPRCA